jgi:predicted nucleic acid-binding protein
MSDLVLLDTNVLVYAEDNSEQAKRDTARQVIERLIAERQAVLTAQVCAEFYSVVTRRFRQSLSDQEVAARIGAFAELMPVLDTSLAVVLEALRGVVRYPMSYYDAQIWAAARLNGIGTVLSEDFQNGQEIEGVRFVDPFATGFDPEAL